MAWAHEREHYRVAYPTALRPKLLVQGVSFDVVDISERGIRFRLGQAERPEPGFELEGVVRFKRGETVNIRGTVLRVVDGEVASWLEEAIPLRVIMEEQRYLLDRHRHLGL
ncbi:MAG TPA: PilZ domain-containing protein [Gemmatimonadales bacterium]|nr:PilZ domain-containing protein [Gemmatimonadales bacterium]